MNDQLTINFSEHVRGSAIGRDQDNLSFVKPDETTRTGTRSMGTLPIKCKDNVEEARLAPLAVVDDIDALTMNAGLRNEENPNEIHTSLPALVLEAVHVVIIGFVSEGHGFDTCRFPIVGALPSLVRSLMPAHSIKGRVYYIEHEGALDDYLQHPENAVRPDLGKCFALCFLGTSKHFDEQQEKHLRVSQSASLQIQLHRLIPLLLETIYE
jgi:hypothetical protein